MAAELEYFHTTSGLTTLVAVLFQGANLVQQSNGALVTANASNLPNGAIALSDSALVYRYLGTIPAGTPAGIYTFAIFVKAGASLATSDLPNMIGITAIHWNGTAIIGLPAIEADTQDLQNRVPASLQSGKMDSYLNAAGLQADAVTEIGAGVTATAVSVTVESTSIRVQD